MDSIEPSHVPMFYKKQLLMRSRVSEHSLPVSLCHTYPYSMLRAHPIQNTTRYVQPQFQTEHPGIDLPNSAAFPMVETGKRQMILPQSSRTNPPVSAAQQRNLQIPPQHHIPLPKSARHISMSPIRGPARTAVIVARNHQAQDTG